MKQLSLIRPKKLSQVIGQDKLVRSLRGYSKSKRPFPKALLFSAPKGYGKTSIAWIIAVSLQCRHREFGEPCKKCWRNYRSFPILDVDCAVNSGVAAIRLIAAHSEYEALGKYRKVFILDEAHNLSGSAQDSLLKYFEADTNAVWIINSTRSDKIVETLKSRCQCYKLVTPTTEIIEQLVAHFLKLANSNLNANDLVEALIERKIDSPRLVAQAVEKYCIGNSPTDSADVEGDTEISAKELCRAVVKGDISSVWSLLSAAPNSDARGLRAAVLGYLKSILYETHEFDKRNDALAKAIDKLCGLSGSEDIVQMAALASELYFLCKIFSEYKR